MTTPCATCRRPHPSPATRPGVWTPTCTPTNHRPPSRRRGAEERWLSQQVTDASRDPDDRERNQRGVESGPMHRACNTYASLSTVIASALVGHCNPDLSGNAADPGRHSRSAPSDPTSRQVQKLIDRVDRAMHEWSHCFAACLDCPDVHRPHDRPGETLDALVDVDAYIADGATGRDLSDAVAATTITHSQVRRRIDRLNMAQQVCAEQALAAWKQRWQDGVEPDLLRADSRLMDSLVRRLRSIARQLGQAT